MNNLTHEQTVEAKYAIRPCGGGWAYCNGKCGDCPATKTYYAVETEAQ